MDDRVEEAKGQFKKKDPKIDYEFTKEFLKTDEVFEILKVVSKKEGEEGKIFAMKRSLTRTCKEEIEKFKRECALLLAIDSNYVVKVFDVYDQ